MNELAEKQNLTEPVSQPNRQETVMPIDSNEMSNSDQALYEHSFEPKIDTECNEKHSGDKK